MRVGSIAAKTIEVSRPRGSGVGPSVGSLAGQEQPIMFPNGNGMNQQT